MCFAHEFLYHDGFLAAVVVVGVVLTEAGTVNLLLGDGHGGPRQFVCLLGSEEVVVTKFIVAVSIAGLPAYVHFLCGRDLVSPADML